MNKKLIVCEECGETKMVETLPEVTDICVGCGKPFEHISLVTMNRIR